MSIVGNLQEEAGEASSNGGAATLSLSALPDASTSSSSSNAGYANHSSSHQSSLPALTLLPRSSVSSSGNSSPLASASSASPTFKIMRRNQSAASISRNLSQSSSLAFDGTTTGSAVTTPDENDPTATRKNRKDMTIEEREAAYRAARERIFNTSEEAAAAATSITPPITTTYDNAADLVPPSNAVSSEALVATELNNQVEKSRSRDRRREKPREKAGGQAWDRGGEAIFDPYAKGKGRFVDSSTSSYIGGDSPALWTGGGSDVQAASSTQAPATFPEFLPRAQKDATSKSMRPLAPSFDPTQSRQSAIPEFYPRQQTAAWPSSRAPEFQPPAPRQVQAAEDYRSAYGASYISDQNSAYRPYNQSHMPTIAQPQDRRLFGSSASSPTTARSPYATPPQVQNFSGHSSSALPDTNYIYNPSAVADMPRSGRTIVNGSSRAAKGLYDPTTGGIVPPAPINELPSDHFMAATAYTKRDVPSTATFPMDLPPLRFGTGILSGGNYSPGNVGFYPVDLSSRKETSQESSSSRPSVHKDTSFSSASSSTSSRSSRPSSQRSPSQSISGAGTPAGVPSSTTITHPLPARPDWALRHDHESTSQSSGGSGGGGTTFAGALSGFKSGNTSRAASVASVATSASFPTSELGSAASVIQPSPSVSVVNVSSAAVGGGSFGISASSSSTRMSSPGGGSTSSSARELSPSASSSASASASLSMSGGMRSSRHSHDDRAGTFTGTASPISTNASGNASIGGTGSEGVGGEVEMDAEQERLSRGLEGLDVGSKDSAEVVEGGGEKNGA